MESSETLKILIVDDTIIYRKIVGEVLKSLPGVEIVGTASNGKTAISRIMSLHPDLITLDIDMPSMDGIEVLTEINRIGLDVGVIMLSSLTYEGGEMTIKALELGAFDFIPKPELESISANKKYIRERLAPMLRSFAGRREIKKILSGQSTFQRPRRTPDATVITPHPEKSVHVPPATTVRKKTLRPHSQVIAIGISTGGPKALAKIIPMIPDNINVPILIVQHMPALFTQSLAQSLNDKTPLTVREAEDNLPLKPNTIFIAPGGRQMKITAGGNRDKIIKITDDPPENSCKPSVDYLFRSVAEHFGAKATAVIMTGMGSDGNRGIALMKEKGAFIIAQNEETCTVFGMPKWPIEAKLVDVVAPLENIAAEITASVKSFE